MSENEQTQGTEAVVVTAITPEVVVGLTAAELDAEIKRKILDMETLVKTKLELAQILKHMRETKGYKALGYKIWEDYLSSLGVGRTYLSLLLKLGKAGDLTRYVEQGMSVSKVLEYAKRIDYPEKIPQAIEATFLEVEPLSVREAGAQLQKYIQAHADEYKRPKKSQETAATTRLTRSAPLDKEVQARLVREYQELAPADRYTFVQGLRLAVEELEN